MNKNYENYENMQHDLDILSLPKGWVPCNHIDCDNLNLAQYTQNLRTVTPSTLELWPCCFRPAPQERTPGSHVTYAPATVSFVTELCPAAYQPAQLRFWTTTCLYAGNIGMAPWATVHSDRFTWRQDRKRSPLFQYAVSVGSRALA